jgi:hypothetical protein
MKMFMVRFLERDRKDLTRNNMNGHRASARSDYDTGS